MEPHTIEVLKRSRFMDGFQILSLHVLEKKKEINQLPPSVHHCPDYGSEIRKPWHNHSQVVINESRLQTRSLVSLEQSWLNHLNHGKGRSRTLVAEFLPEGETAWISHEMLSQRISHAALHKRGHLRSTFVASDMYAVLILLFVMICITMGVKG